MEASGPDLKEEDMDPTEAVASDTATLRSEVDITALLQTVVRIVIVNFKNKLWNRELKYRM